MCRAGGTWFAESALAVSHRVPFQGSGPNQESEVCLSVGWSGSHLSFPSGVNSTVAGPMSASSSREPNCRLSRASAGLSLCRANVLSPWEATRFTSQASLRSGSCTTTMRPISGLAERARVSTSTQSSAFKVGYMLLPRTRYQRRRAQSQATSSLATRNMESTSLVRSWSDLTAAPVESRAVMRAIQAHPPFSRPGTTPLRGSWISRTCCGFLRSLPSARRRAVR